MAQLWARQLLCLVACICLAPALAIYEEQAGEHDWLLQHVGHVQHAALGSGDQLIVGTEANAVASLGLDTGAVQVHCCLHVLLLQVAHGACRVLLPCLHSHVLLPVLCIAIWAHVIDVLLLWQAPIEFTVFINSCCLCSGGECWGMETGLTVFCCWSSPQKWSHCPKTARCCEAGTAGMGVSHGRGASAQEPASSLQSWLLQSTEACQPSQC